VTSLEGTVISGLGRGAHFVGLEWVRQAVRDALGFDPYPGTLNLRLTDAATRAAWCARLAGPALSLTPPPPGGCGGRLFPVLVAPDIPGAVVVPDVTGHAGDVLELIAGAHVRSRLHLRDGDRVTVHVHAGGRTAREVEKES
jgi:riboflavin kinase